IEFFDVVSMKHNLDPKDIAYPATLRSRANPVAGNTNSPLRYMVEYLDSTFS
ncbi:hypothetical protein BGZ98_007518, partial [Dissophora globulifera]